MFTRLLVGLDDSPRADAALEQAVVLGKRFRSTIVAVHVRGDGGGAEGTRLLDGARERVLAGELEAEIVDTVGAPDVALADLAQGADAVLVGRSGSTTRGPALGPTTAALIRISSPCVIVCAGTASPMRQCAVAFDGGDTSLRALSLAARFASIADATLHVIHAATDRAVALRVVGVAEATLSLRRVAFVTHVETGQPGEVIGNVIRQTRCDGLFVGAHARSARTSAPSHAEEILRHTAIPVVVQP